MKTYLYKKRWKLLGMVGVVGISVLIRLLLPMPAMISTGLEIVDKNGYVLYQARYEPYHHIHDIPKEIIELIVMIEDRRFYEHPGIDVKSLGRAFLNNMQGKPIQGASTLDQQLIKLSRAAYTRTWWQKMVEMASAVKMNILFSKDEILLAYSNAVPFPYGTQGIAAGCRLYFGVSCDQLSHYQQLFLVASWQVGGNPFTKAGFEKVSSRAKELCGIVYGQQNTTEVSCETVSAMRPRTIEDLVGIPEQKAMHRFQRYLSQVGNDSMGLMHTTFDYRLRERIETILAKTNIQRKMVEAEDCCVVVTDTQGNVISMNVCRARGEEESGQVNTCLRKRQTGSASKPFLYAYALTTLGLDMNDTIVDEPVTYYIDDQAAYTPKNFDLRYHGEVSLAQALGSSLNIPAVKLLHDAGVPGFVEFLGRVRAAVGEDAETIVRDARRFSAEKQGLSLALGTYELSPLEFIRMRTIFLNSTAQSRLSSYTSALQTIESVLSEDRRRTLSFGIDSFLDVEGRSVKTGTSRHFVDGRTCGVHSELGYAICVRMGNASAKPMNDGGANTAGYLWKEIAAAVETISK